MSFPLLPTELQDLIIDNLHPNAALALSKTNHYYHSVVSLKRLDPDIVRGFLRNLEQRPSNRFADLACYKCLCLKPRWQFMQRTPSFTNVRRPNSQDRQCVQCDVRDGYVKPSDIYYQDYRNFLVCTECFDPQNYYCSQCRSCARCLEKKAILCCKGCKWCDACTESKSREWESEMIEIYIYEFWVGLAVLAASKYHLLGSHDRSDTVIRCTQPGHAERYDKGRSIPFGFCERHDEEISLEET